MSRFSIKDLENLSGIKAHTIRIWEQRYSLLNPQRSETNIRSYGQEDLKMLLNIVMLKDSGYKISKIAKMTEPEICASVDKMAKGDQRYEIHVNALTSAMVEFDEQRFEKIISTAILQNGLLETMKNVVFPFLQRTGIHWLTGVINPAQEHFISNLIRQKLLVAIDGQVVRRRGVTPVALLFLPSGERHEISLLFLSYMLKVQKYRVLYLGADVPLKDVRHVAEQVKPSFLFSFVCTSLAGSDHGAYFRQLSADLPIPIYLGGAQAASVSQDLDGLYCLDSFDEIIDFVEALD